ncbi:MAG: SPOR domain-containing protein [Bacteroidota bacterium]
MSDIKQEDLNNLYEEIDKANGTIHDLSTVITEDEEKISVLKKHRIIFGIVSLLLLLLFIWSFIPKNNKIEDEYLIKNNLSLINTDSLHDLQLKVDKIQAIDTSLTSIKELPIVYSVQIGAYSNFASNLFSDNFSHLSEFEQSGMNKFALGNYNTYKEAFQLRKDLRRLGFKDCFIIAKSYGEPVNIGEALQLSGEKWIREK